MAENARPSAGTNTQNRRPAVRKTGNRPNKIRRFIGEVDRPFLIIIVLLVCIGLITVFSASYSFSEKYYHDSYYLSKPQLYLALLGLALMAFIAFFPSAMLRLLNATAVWIFLGTLALNLLVPLIGVTIGGATRWIKLGPLPQFQPSELLKFSLVLIFSWYTARFQDRMNSFGYGFIGYMMIG
ncbi:MAG: FtsW/RodA/SpoVE family cell cycle protein, partial [Clostridia bacterium]|nr:FtsW/RodA/SpoVE family cell cycle protein [Clostridia bacterium]